MFLRIRKPKTVITRRRRVATGEREPRMVVIVEGSMNDDHNL